MPLDEIPTKNTYRFPIEFSCPDSSYAEQGIRGDTNFLLAFFQDQRLARFARDAQEEEEDKDEAEEKEEDAKRTGDKEAVINKC